MADLALLITMTLAGDRPLAGPRPGHVLDSVPHADVIRASVDGIPGLIGNLDSDTHNVLLTLARIWNTLSTGQIRSKGGAADWAICALPPGQRPVLEHAKNLYLNCSYSQESWIDALRVQVHPCANHVLAEIDRLTQDHELSLCPGDRTITGQRSPIGGADQPARDDSGVRASTARSSAIGTVRRMI